MCTYVSNHLGPTKCISPAEVELKSNMRKLWEEHVAWTRMTILSLNFKSPDVDAVIARLLQNATDMGDALRPFYGNQIGDEFSALIKEHLVIAADLVKAAIAGDQQAAIAAEKKWYSNADEIAAFLSRINPYLCEEEVRKMFYSHLALTKSEAVLMINNNYKKSIEVYDEIQKQALGMADAITEGIVKQFPNMFG
ncbi:acetylglutamate kinase [Viridibacillus soli]